MSASDFRREARLKLQGHWGNAVCVVFCYFIIFFLLELLSGLLGESASLVISILILIIEIPLSFGLILSLFEIYKNGESKIFNFASIGFNNFGKSWGISFNIFLKLLLPMILIIFSLVLLIGTSTAVFLSSSSSFAGLSIIGFILYVVSLIWITTKSYYYRIAYIIAADDTSLNSSSVVQKSQYLMSGYRGKLFALHLSFIGWFILMILVSLLFSAISSILGSLVSVIGIMFLLPYMQFSTFAFYDHINPELAHTRTVSDEDIL